MKKLIRARGFALSVLLAIWAAAGATAVRGECPLVETVYGPVLGAEPESGVCAYKGLPLASPPVGELRFAPPAPPEPWSEPRPAAEFGPECYQYPLGLSPTIRPTGSEDCLYLNVWTPAGAEPGSKPVMVFIHGGGFATGSGSIDIYHGRNLAAKGGVVAVTFNYRLAGFGFMVHPALEHGPGARGNYALLDQVAALEWIRDNIAGFGGDPDNVTLFGESAGGMSVAFHLVSPLSRGLFHKAAIQSGPVHMAGTPVEKAAETGLRAAAKLGCDDPDTAASCMRQVPGPEFMDAIPTGMGNMMGAEAKEFYSFGPVIDGLFLPEVPITLLERGDYAVEVPVVLGMTRDEIALFVIQTRIGSREELDREIQRSAEMIEHAFGFQVDLGRITELYDLDSYGNYKKAFIDMATDVGFRCPTVWLADILAQNQPDIFLYQFSRPPVSGGLFGDLGAFHGSELPFVFGNFSFGGFGISLNMDSPENSELSDKLIGYWSSFARDGEPASEGAPNWPRYEPGAGAYMDLDLELRVDHKLKAEVCGGLLEFLEL